jgi:hypothetical protein
MIKIQHKVNMEGLKAKGRENRATMQTEGELDWNKSMARGSMTSWKDEYWTIILSIPLIGCFIPKVAPHILKGFEVLQTTPNWYKAAVGLAIAASFGYRKFADWNMRRVMVNGGGPSPSKKHPPVEPPDAVDDVIDARP